jgi:probable F420-dependent oxidoreductase
MKVDLLLSADPPEARQRAIELAGTGADGLFSFENAHDVFFPLVLAAGAAEIDLMTNVAIALPRSPFHLAQAAYDLQRLTEGRFRLGLGTQVRAHIERRYGARWDAPVAQMKEIVLATKAILSAYEDGGPPQFRGEFGTHTLLPSAFNPGPNPYGVAPVLVGALGPRMTEMAAECADGVLVMPFNSARHLRQRTLPALERGLARRRRDASTFEVVGEAIVAVGRSEEELAAARQGVRWLLAFYGSTPAYRPVLEAEGWGDLQPVLNAMSKQGEWMAMAELVSEEMIATLAVVGSPTECAQQIKERFGAMATRMCCYFPGYEVGEDCLGELVDALHAS